MKKLFLILSIVFVLVSCSNEKQTTTQKETLKETPEGIESKEESTFQLLNPKTQLSAKETGFLDYGEIKFTLFGKEYVLNQAKFSDLINDGIKFDDEEGELEKPLGDLNYMRLQIKNYDPYTLEFSANADSEEDKTLGKDSLVHKIKISTDKLNKDISFNKNITKDLTREELVEKAGNPSYYLGVEETTSEFFEYTIYNDENKPISYKFEFFGAKFVSVSIITSKPNKY